MPGFETLSVVLRLSAGCWLLWRIASPAPVPARQARASCTIVVPARDEAAALPVLLASLMPQLADGDEVVVVDDHSSDETAVVAGNAGAVVLAAPALPEGWTGKAWACSTGAAAATNELLVFFDADVTVAAGGLDRLIAAHHRYAPDGLLSVQPYHETGRPYERLSILFNVIAMMGTDAFTPLGARRAPAGAFGPCLVTARQGYERVGGHASVASAVLDDVALARRYQASGRRVVCLGGRGTLSFRMYPGGLRPLVDGWSKNIAGGAGATRLTTTVLIVAWVSVLIQAPWWAGRALLTGDAAPFALLVYAAVVVQLAWMARRVGRFGAMTRLLFPVALVFFLLVFTRSAFLTIVSREVPWKGRVLPTGFKPGA